MAQECKLVGVRRPNLPKKAPMEALVGQVANHTKESEFTHNLLARLKWTWLWFCVNRESSASGTSSLTIVPGVRDWRLEI